MGQEIISLESAIAHHLKRIGYSTQSGVKQEEEVRFAKLPGVVIYPIMIEEMEGNKECRVTSKCEVLFVKNALGVDSNALFRLNNSIRRDIFKLVEIIKCERNVVDVTQVESEVVESEKSLLEDYRVLLSLTIVTRHGRADC